jgi:hypothetical protein
VVARLRYSKKNNRITFDIEWLYTLYLSYHKICPCTFAAFAWETSLYHVGWIIVINAKMGGNENIGPHFDYTEYLAYQKYLNDKHREENIAKYKAIIEADKQRRKV